MSEQDNAQEKSFDPTPQKLQKAREKGDVPKSQDVLTAASYAGLIVVLLISGADLVEDFGSQLLFLLQQSGPLANAKTDTNAYFVLSTLIGKTLWTLAPLFLVPMLLVVGAIFAQRAFVFSATKIQPKMSRISPVSNAKQKYGANGLFEFMKSFVKMLTYSVVLWFFVSKTLPDFFWLPMLEPGQILHYLAQNILQFLTLILLVSVVIGAIDLVWQNFDFIKRNRMSKKELTDETKESEGDPFLKQERRQRAQAAAFSQMMADVPKADVIIVNPTHYAIALQWKRGQETAPRCVAKGVDEMAHSIRTTAEDAQVPIYSDPPTARLLHASLKLGEEIRVEHYQAVAVAIRFADHMRAKSKRGF